MVRFKYFSPFAILLKKIIFPTALAVGFQMGEGVNLIISFLVYKTKNITFLLDAMVPSTLGAARSISGQSENRGARRYFVSTDEVG